MKKQSTVEPTERNKQSTLKKLGIYVHIPFCERKCDYCDFVSFCMPENKKIDYVNAIVSEICHQGAKYRDYEVDTIFVGGGTPSCMPNGAINKIMNAIFNNFSVLKTAEITIECNPNSLTFAKLKEYRASHINRLSIGLQAYNNKLLKLIGRLHTKKQFDTAISMARICGFENISVDLILGIPKQKVFHTKSQLRHLKKLKIKHISAYQLIVEDGTKLKRNLENGVYKLPSEAKQQKMFDATIKYLEKNGFVRYEVSNFALHGSESKHNKKYWTNQDYLGLGLHSSSFVNKVRWKNTSDLNKYISKIDSGEDVTEDVEVLDKQSQIEECVMLSLRTKEGINLVDFENRFGFDLCKTKSTEIEDMLKNGLLQKSQTHIFCTKKGFDFLNQIIINLI